MSKVTIIAEAGINHDGDINKALRLADATKGAGADILKTQTYIADRCVRPGPALHKLANVALSFGETERLARHCTDIGIEFCSTPDDLDSLKFLVEECGVKRIKIGSGSLLYEPLVDAAFDTGLPILLSTGMATMQEVRDVVYRQRLRWLKSEKSNSMNHLTVMHCVSLYPCPPKLANVLAVAALARLSPSVWHPNFFAVGYSDHTMGPLASLMAVSLGATVIEKHFTLNNTDDGPDHSMSADFRTFQAMVDDIRLTEWTLGTGIKEPSAEEVVMIPRLRKDAEGYQPGL